MIKEIWIRFDNFVIYHALNPSVKSIGIMYFIIPLIIYRMMTRELGET